MISWSEFKRKKPDWAKAGLRLFAPDGDGIGFLATVAKDGRPRMAPVCPVDPIYELNVNRGLWAHWIHPGQPDTKVVKQTWQANSNSQDGN